MTVRNGERGQATIMMAVFMGIVLLGFIGFAVDVGYFFQEKRQAQSAADGAAIAAAEESSYSTTYAQNAANAVAQLNGFPTSMLVGNNVTLEYPSTGSYSGSSAPGGYVRATVSVNVPTFFLSAFSHGTMGTMTVSASAMAGEGESSPTCICLEGTTGMDLNMSNNSKLNASGCGVTVDSSSSNAVGVVGSAKITALSLGTVSTNWDNSSNINNGGSIASSTDIVTGISTKCAPTLPAIPTYSNCSNDPFNSISGGGAKYTVGPGSSYGTTTTGNVICYNALSVNLNGDTTTLNAGVYVINGGSLHFASGSNGGGTGVFFYLVNGASLTIDNGANPKLSAPTSGVYSNILIFQDSADTRTLSFQGGSGSSFTGAVYAPGASINIANGSTSNINMDIVAQSLTMAGGGILNATSQVNMGTLNISSATLSQ